MTKSDVVSIILTSRHMSLDFREFRKEIQETLEKHDREFAKIRKAELGTHTLLQSLAAMMCQHWLPVIQKDFNGTVAKPSKASLAHHSMSNSISSRMSM